MDKLFFHKNTYFRVKYNEFLSTFDSYALQLVTLLLTFVKKTLIQFSLPIYEFSTPNYLAQKVIIAKHLFNLKLKTWSTR